MLMQQGAGPSLLVSGFRLECEPVQKSSMHLKEAIFQAAQSAGGIKFMKLRAFWALCQEVTRCPLPLRKLEGPLQPRLNLQNQEPLAQQNCLSL